MSLFILEARQKAENSIITQNGDWESILMEPVILEQGDTLSMTSAFVDTTENQSNSIFVKEDLILFFDYLIYQELDNLAIPSAGALGVNSLSYTRFWAPGQGPLTLGASPAPLCQWSPPGTNRFKCIGWTVKWIDPVFPMKAVPIILEYIDAGGRLARIVLQLPEVERRGDFNDDIVHEHTLLTLNEVEGCSIGNGFITKTIGIDNIINRDDLHAANIQFIQFNLLEFDFTQNLITPYQRHFSFRLKAGRYHPNDLAQILTRATQETGNASFDRFVVGGSINDDSLSSRLAKGYSQNLQGSIATTEGPHFYTDQRYYDFISPSPKPDGAGNPNVMPENTIQPDKDLNNRFCFMWSNAGIPGLEAATRKRQLFSYKNPVIEASGDVDPAQTARPQDLFNMRMIGSSQGVGFTYDEDSNRFQIDYTHSPYYLTGGTVEGEIGYSYVDTQVADPGDTGPGGGQSMPEPSYNSRLCGSLGGVLLTCLSSAPASNPSKKNFKFFGDTMGFDINDTCVRMSFEETALDTGPPAAGSGASSYIWSYAAASQIWGVANPDITGEYNKPLTPYIVIPYAIHNRSIQGADQIRNYLYGRKLTSAYNALSDAITFTESSASPPIPDPQYIFSQPAITREWSGVRDGSTPYEMTGWTTGTEGSTTDTTFIRARDFAQGTLLSSAYYLVEIGGVFKNKFIGSSYYSKMITGILNRYYSTGQFTSGSTPFSYTHIGVEPIFIRSLKVRFLNPDGTLASGIGEDNSIMLTLEKNTNNIQKAMIPIIDEFTPKDVVAAVLKEGGGPANSSFL